MLTYYPFIINMDYLEKESRNQADSQLWNVERRNRIIASNFGKICKMRSHTSCKNTVHGLLYGNNIHARALDYGKSMEQYARNEFENKFGLKVSPACLFDHIEIPY
jgi:predicted phage-related endonuclease